MARYVPDVKTQRWVVITPARSARPLEEGKTEKIPVSKSVCPFCAGNEHLTPPEVYRIGGGEKDKTGWQVRVVPNKYPITDIHEVIIHSPDNSFDLEKLPRDQVIRVVTAYRDRYQAHESDGQVLIFCNHGFHAGASLAHPHAQLVVVPRQINLDSLSLEPVANVVTENEIFVTYCPDFSQWPYEVWIAPKESGHKFGDLLDRDSPIFAESLQTALQRIEKVLSSPAQPFKQANEPFVYNYYIYPGNNWFIRIIPRAVHRAGFELGTGLNVNVVDPVQAALRLKEVII
jgi:UDPglucose--hexose-1-phosphate uridylyltransferase